MTEFHIRYSVRVPLQIVSLLFPPLLPFSLLYPYSDLSPSHDRELDRQGLAVRQPTPRIVRFAHGSLVVRLQTPSSG